jgi:ZIP family zinc transporter
MQSLLIMTVAFGTFLATLAGGALALRFRDQLHLILGFSAGAIIGLAFFDLLPEALKIGSGDPSTLLSVTALGFFGYATLDRLILLHTHHDDADHAHDAPAVKRGWAGAGSLSAHSLIDGLAIGIAFRASSSVGIVVAAAVLAHDCSDGMNTVNLVLRNAGSRQQAFQWLLVDAAAPVLGAALSLFLTLPGEALSLVLALFAGFFLYIGASDLLPESFHAHPKALTTIMTLMGATTLYIVARLAG